MGRGSFESGPGPRTLRLQGMPPEAVTEEVKSSNTDRCTKTFCRVSATLTDPQVVNDGDGVPSLNVQGEALRILAERGAAIVHVSISHTSEHAVAQVILEK